MRRLALFLLLPAGIGAQAPARDPAVILDRAIERMGGSAALHGVRTIRLDVMTQWLRVNFSAHPYADVPTYERHQDLRDYTASAWRNTRAFPPAGGSVDIVRDTVGARSLTGPNGTASAVPLNVAYVDERRELFAFAPERTLVLAREATDLRALTDTTIDGVVHQRVAATVDGFPATWAIRGTDGLLAMVRFRADETNDFGLAPWGVMDVEIWYSNWTSVPPGILLPRERDVRRVGRPYKRMTMLSIAVNAPAPADSFAIADSLVSRYLSDERRPMWAVPLDSVRIVENDFVAFPPFAGVGAAVRVGGRWVLIETGQAAGAAQRVAAWLERTTPGVSVAAGIVTSPTPGNGGVRWFAENRLPLFIAPGAQRNVTQMLGAATAAARSQTVTSSRWIKVGTDSLWLERLELPDAPGALAVYSPTHRWLYGGLLIGRPLVKAEQDVLIARLRARGLAVEFVGGVRGVRQPAP